MMKPMLKGLTILCSLALAGSAFAQTTPGEKTEMKTEAKTDPKAEAKKAAQMEAFMKAGTPGEQHAAMKKMVGTWDVASKWWENPKAAPMESKGTATYEMVLGDRFLRQTYKGDMMGQPFEGVGTTGYNNLTKKYQSTWMDSTSTQMYTSEGTASKDGKMISMQGEGVDAMTGKKMKSFETMTFESDTKVVFRMYEGTSAKGKLMMELTYTKK
jgi:hypothetical protein